MPIADVLVRATLTWEATTHQAEMAHHRLSGAFIDLNDLRVSMPEDIVAVLGERYPLAEERALRLRAMLNDVFAREYSPCLDRLRSVAMREAREYLRTLEGCPEYAASFVVLHGLGGHAIPVDERLAMLLMKEGVLAGDSGPQALSKWLEHHVHADQGAEVHAALQQWSDRDGHPPKREKRVLIPPAAEKKVEAHGTAGHESQSPVKAEKRARSETAKKSESTKKPTKPAKARARKGNA
ncbi:MAG: hypothetical protein JSR77_05235 [Planctomycetes bacterium]|nr:hypothetical protein [Planctomycetota bacterium]